MTDTTTNIDKKIDELIEDLYQFNLKIKEVKRRINSLPFTKKQLENEIKNLEQKIQKIQENKAIQSLRKWNETQRKKHTGSGVRSDYVWKIKEL